jgi:hypothetical protein
MDGNFAASENQENQEGCVPFRRGGKSFADDLYGIGSREIDFRPLNGLERVLDVCVASPSMKTSAAPLERRVV